MPALVIVESCVLRDCLYWFVLGWPSFLVPIDDRCLKPDELRAYEKGESKPDAVKPPTSGMFDPMLVAFSKEEKQTLVADTIHNLGEVCVTRRRSRLVFPCILCDIACSIRHTWSLPR